MSAGRLPIWRNAIENPQPIARAICVVLAIALIGIELWPAISAQFDAPRATQPRAGAAATHSTVDIEQITSAELFGHAANQNTHLPQTNLQVTLRAVFAAIDPKTASAVIETSDGRAQMVKIGGAIDSSTTLQAVHSNSVVLSRNGALETLYFPTPQESTVINVAQNAQLPDATNAAETNLPTAASAEDIKRAAILQRLEELRARTPR